MTSPSPAITSESIIIVDGEHCAPHILRNVGQHRIMQAGNEVEASTIIRQAVTDYRLGHVYHHCMIDRLSYAMSVIGWQTYSSFITVDSEELAFWSDSHWEGIATVTEQQTDRRLIKRLRIDHDCLLELFYERAHRAGL